MEANLFLVMTLEWRCKTPHKSCESQDWKHYRDLPADEARRFIEIYSDKSTNFEYRIKPESENENVRLQASAA